MALCIYEHGLFPMHLYHYGRNLEIYVTVVNRSSTLLWMISEWFCWSWDMHRLVSIYLPTLYFIVFAKKGSPNVNLQLKRDIELQKPVAHTSIWLGKRESDQKYKIVWCPKSQRLTHQSEISKISGINLTMRCCFKKIKWYVKHGAKWKASKILYLSLCEKLYMHTSIIEMGHIIWC